MPPKLKNQNTVTALNTSLSPVGTCDVVEIGRSPDSRIMTFSDPSRSMCGPVDV